MAKDISKIEEGAAMALGFLVQQTPTDTDNEILKRVGTRLAELRAKGKMTNTQFVRDGIGKIVDGVTDLTGTPLDDLFVDGSFNAASGLIIGKLDKKFPGNV